jgi:hypothetical protein
MTDDTLREFASFLSELRQQTLEDLNIISFARMRLETFQALGGHGKSLTRLRLTELDEPSIVALAALGPCTALQSLYISGGRTALELKSQHPDAFLGIEKWLQGCKKLLDVTFREFGNAMDLLTSLVHQVDIHLESLQLYERHHESGSQVPFYRGLRQQTSLRRLHLMPHESPMSVHGLAVDAICNLSGLRELTIGNAIFLCMEDEHAARLALALPELVTLQLTGVYFTDRIWNYLANLKNLKSLYFTSETHFTCEGILGYIDRLDVGNMNMTLSILSADLEWGLSHLEQEQVRQAIVAKVNGKFEFVMIRGIGLRRQRQYPRTLSDMFSEVDTDSDDFDVSDADFTTTAAGEQ